MIPHPLYILRHGQTVWNAEGRMQGWLNSPLTKQGEMDAARQFEIMRGRDLSGFEVVCSPSGRAFQTAAIAIGPLVQSIRTDPRLQEIGVGDWQGKLRADLPKRGGEDWVFRQYEDAPNGEGFAALKERCADFLSDLTGPAVLVTHGITSRMIRSLVVGKEALQASTPNGGQGMVWHVADGRQHLLR